VCVRVGESECVCVRERVRLRGFDKGSNIADHRRAHVQHQDLNSSRHICCAVD
jgi:hypothetical protein